MKSKISYQIIPENKIVLECFCGDLLWKDLINNKKKLLLEKEYDPTFNIIDDVRNAFVTYDEDDIKEFVELISDNKKLYGKRKSVILTKTPNQIINSIMLDSLKKSLPINFKSVSTLQEALKWVEISHKDYQFIEDSLDKLKCPN